MQYKSSNGRWTLIGVASFFASVACQSDKVYPDGFTRVRSYLDWIYARTDIPQYGTSKDNSSSGNSNPTSTDYFENDSLMTVTASRLDLSGSIIQGSTFPISIQSSVPTSYEVTLSTKTEAAITWAMSYSTKVKPTKGISATPKILIQSYPTTSSAKMNNLSKENDSWSYHYETRKIIFFVTALNYFVGIIIAN